MASQIESINKMSDMVCFKVGGKHFKRSHSSSCTLTLWWRKGLPKICLLILTEKLPPLGMASDFDLFITVFSNHDKLMFHHTVLLWCQALCIQFGYYDGHKLSWYLQNFLQHCQIIEICHYILLTITLQLSHPWPWIKNFSFSQRNSTTFLKFVPLPKSNMCCLQWTFCRSWFIHKKAFSM